MLEKKVDLIQGSIVKGLTKLALPIMATAFLQMAYNLVDMIWIGKVGSDAVAAVGVAGMYIWLSNGLIMVARIGTQVKVAQHLGAKEPEEAVYFAKSGFQMAICFGLFYGLICIFFRESLVGFFQLDNPEIINSAIAYLVITGGFIIVNYVNQIFTGIWTALGNSQVTLIATLVGVLINFVLDPVFIFGLGPFPQLGVIGAAMATLLAQVIVCITFFIVVRKEEVIFKKIKNIFKVELCYCKNITKIGLPAGIQNMLFTLMSMVIARMITQFGDAAIAVQKVGSQIESISWLTADGFSTAVNAFVAQNKGAGQEVRVDKGYKTAFVIMLLWGVFTSTLLIVYPAQLFGLFIDEAEVIQIGINYLRIMGYSQLFMCMELATAGAFQGLGRSLPPSIIGTIFIAARIPLAYGLIQTSLGLDGIWWAISITSVIKGIILPIWFIYIRRKSRGKKVHEFI